jgi:hypothetical protein
VYDRVKGQHISPFCAYFGLGDHKCILLETLTSLYPQAGCCLARISVGQ